MLAISLEGLLLQHIVPIDWFLISIIDGFSKLDGLYFLSSLKSFNNASDGTPNIDFASKIVNVFLFFRSFFYSQHIVFDAWMITFITWQNEILINLFKI